MKLYFRRVFALFLGLALCLCLFACGGSGGAEDAPAALVNRAAGALTDIVVKNDGQSFTLSQSEGAFACPELARCHVPLSTQGAESLVALSTTLSAKKVDAADPRACGIDGLHTVTLSFTQGDTVTLLLGAPLDGEPGCYFSVEGRQGVYAGTSDAFKYYLRGAASLADLSLFSADYAVGQTPAPDALTLENAAGVFSVTRLARPLTDGYGNACTFTLAVQGEEAIHFLAADAYDNCFSVAAGAPAGSIYALAPDAQTLSACGLTRPAARLTVTAGGQTQTLSVGMRQGDNFFVTMDGVDAIYTVAARYADLADVTRQTLESRFLCAPPRDETRSITVMTPGTGDFYIVDVFETYGTVDGGHLDDGTFSGLYRLLCSLQGEYALDSAADTDPDSLTLTFGLQDGTTRVLKLVPYDQKRMAVFLDGVFTGWGVRTAFKDKVLQTLGQVTNGQVIDPVW